MLNKKELINEYKNRKQIGGICKITNKENGKLFLFVAPDIDSSRNRFEFMKKTNNYFHHNISKDWEKYGKEVFEFDVLDKLEKKETQTSKEFLEDLNELLEIYLNKFEKNNLYN